MSHVPIETVEEDAADLQFPKAEPSLTLIDRSVEENLPQADIRVLNALQDFIQSDNNQILADELIVNFVDHLKKSYGEPTSTELASFEHYYEVANFRFTNESVETLLDLIKHFNSVREIFHPGHSRSKYVAITCQKFTVEVNEVYFYVKLRLMIDEMLQLIDDFDLNKNKANYIRILAVCAESPKMFQHFYKLVAKKMIKWNFPEVIQAYIKQFVFDVRLRKQNYAQFNRMYDDNLFFYVEMISKLLYGSDDEYSQVTDSDLGRNRIVCDILKGLRESDFERFVILVTHFQPFRYLLE